MTEDKKAKELTRKREYSRKHYAQIEQVRRQKAIDQESNTKFQRQWLTKPL